MKKKFSLNMPFSTHYFIERIEIKVARRIITFFKFMNK